VGSISDKMGNELRGTGVFWNSKIICHPVAREPDELSQTFRSLAGVMGALDGKHFS
jgi:hypothetical protein